MIETREKMGRHSYKFRQARPVDFHQSVCIVDEIRRSRGLLTVRAGRVYW